MAMLKLMVYLVLKNKVEESISKLNYNLISIFC